MKPELYVSNTPEEAAKAVAEVILQKAKEKNKQSLPLNMAVSGGNTPVLLFSMLATEYAEKIPWHIVRIFWVDERCVPPVHPDSNFGKAFDLLLQKVPIHDANIFRIQGEADPETAAKLYLQIVESQLPQKNNLPLFDLILLGMGDDGHTASIFPDSMSLLNVANAVAVSTHPASGQKRITLTGQVINSAADVLFLVTGGSKAPVLHDIFTSSGDYRHYPATFIHAANRPAVFFTDRDAMGESSQI